MTWIIFSILAALTWSIINIFDKFLLTKWVKDASVTVAALGLANLLAGGIILFFHHPHSIPGWNILVCLIAGVLYSLGNWLYFMAAQKEEISKVIPLLYLDPLYTALLAVILLHEILSPEKYLGIGLLIIGAVLISTDKFKISIKKEARFAIFAAPVAFAICNVLNKLSFNNGDFWTVLAYYRMGSFLGLFFVFIFKFNSIFGEIKKLGNKIVFIFANESLNVIGAIFFALAIAGGFVSEANALTAVQPFFVLIFATLVTWLWPKFIQEHVTKMALTTKLFAIGFIFAGTILIIR